MKFRPLTLAKKIWLTVIASILITIAFSFFLSNLFYEKLYVEKVGNDLIDEGELLALDYLGGPLTTQLREKIEWYNQKNDSDVFIVSNPKELSACLPFDINYDTLITDPERQALLEGETVTKLGYEPRFKRNIMAAIVPLVDDNRLEGIIYLYVPLANISELTREFTFLWASAALIFMVVSIYLGTLLVRKLTKPLDEMKQAAMLVGEKNYNVRVPISTNDEIGQLGRAFNFMADSIQKEDERKRDFLANVSHELRTPISYVKGYSEILLARIETDELRREQYLSLINREAGRMERLVGDLLDLSRLDSEEYRLELTPIPLAQLIFDSLQKYIPTATEKGLDFSYELDFDIVILGDEGRLEQIIQNVVDNALHYTKSGRISVRLLQKQTERLCHLLVEDTGIGIPAEDLPNITKRFYRVNKGRTRKDGGTGLGLAITESIVRLHHGEMWLRSEPNKGTTVTIQFPLVINE